MASENAQETIAELNALLAFLRGLGYDTSTVTLETSINIFTRVKAVLDEELNI